MKYVIMFKRRFPPAMGNDLKLNYKRVKRRKGKEKKKQGFGGFWALPVGFC